MLAQRAGGVAHAACIPMCGGLEQVSKPQIGVLNCEVLLRLLVICARM
jgi:hypothetical protein